MTDRDSQLSIEPIEVLASPGSPYSRKMLALLRYRRIAYRVIWGTHRHPPVGYPAPKVKLLPTVYCRDASGALEALVDSTPIAKKFEQDYPARSATPDDPALAFYNDLIEDYADEWLTKPMFHYRWYHEVDRINAGPLLSHWGNITRLSAEAEQFATEVTRQQFERLYVVGSNDTTAQTIENSFERVVEILDRLLGVKGYVLGSRPATADFALYGQLSQLGVVEPTPAAILGRRSARVRAWVDQMEDLSGLEPQAGDWFSADEARRHLPELLAEIGRVYVPFLLANAATAEAGAITVETVVDGRAWRQPMFPYQIKCLAALRSAFAALPEEIRSAVGDSLAEAGCVSLTQ